MPSPFPGMDPYLEGNLWTSFHAVFITEIVRQLNPRLAPRYLALVDKYHLVDAPSEIAISPEGIVPDVGVLQASRSPMEAVAAAVISPSVEVQTVLSSKVPQRYLKIVDAQERKLVTLIEVLSPANKRGAGRKKYLRKRDLALHSPVHLLEIDLLRLGRRVPMAQPLPAASYYVLLSRASRRPLSQVWPIHLDQPMPTVPVPLMEPDADVALDLQRAFDETYETSGFQRAIRYREPPQLTLDPQEQRWLDERLRAAKQRP